MHWSSPFSTCVATIRFLSSVLSPWTAYNCYAATHIFMLYIYACLFTAVNDDWLEAKPPSYFPYNAVCVWLCADGVISLGRCLMDWINATNDDGDGDGKGHQTKTPAWTIMALIHLICAPLWLTVQIPEKNSFRWYIKSCWVSLRANPAHSSLWHAGVASNGMKINVACMPALTHTHTQRDIQTATATRTHAAASCEWLFA